MIKKEKPSLANQKASVSTGGLLLSFFLYIKYNMYLRNSKLKMKKIR